MISWSSKKTTFVVLTFAMGSSAALAQGYPYDQGHRYRPISAEEQSCRQVLRHIPNFPCDRVRPGFTQCVISSNQMNYRMHGQIGSSDHIDPIRFCFGHFSLPRSEGEEVPSRRAPYPYPYGGPSEYSDTPDSPDQPSEEDTYDQDNSYQDNSDTPDDRYRHRPGDDSQPDPGDDSPYPHGGLIK